MVSYLVGAATLSHRLQKKARVNQLELSIIQSYRAINFCKGTYRRNQNSMHYVCAYCAVQPYGQKATELPLCFLWFYLLIYASTSSQPRNLKRAPFLAPKM